MTPRREHREDIARRAQTLAATSAEHGRLSLSLLVIVGPYRVVDSALDEANALVWQRAAAFWSREARDQLFAILGE